MLAEIISDWVLVLTLIVAFCLFFYLYYISRFPYGPKPLPFIGNLHQIDHAYPHRQLMKWSKKFGPVFTVWLPKPTIIVTSLDSLKEALLTKGENFAARPQTFLYGVFTGHRPQGDGIILCSGPKWITQRRFALKTFRDFGMGKKQMEERIGWHCERMCERIEERIRAGGGIIYTDLHEELSFCFGSVIHDLVTGKKYDYGSEEFTRFKKLLDNILKKFTDPSLLLVDSAPLFRYFSPTFRQYEREGFEIQRYFEAEIQQHIHTFDPNREPENFIDAYLREMHTSADPLLSQKSLVLNAGDLWTGGLETVVTTIRWALLYLIHYPNVQMRCQREIDSITGGERPIRLADRSRLHYCRATMDESQRLANVLPWNIPHRATRQCRVAGVEIPRNATVIPLLAGAHFDPTLFPDPDFFDPGRYLSKDGKYGQLEALAAFGYGKRACMGESLARMELFIVFTALLQRFRFGIDPQVGKPDLRRSPGMVSVPLPTRYSVRIREPMDVGKLMAPMAEDEIEYIDGMVPEEE